MDDEEEEVDEGEEEEDIYQESGGGIEGVAVAIPKEVAGNGRGPVEGAAAAEEHDGSQAEGEEEKKEHEPFAVPTAGAFYMHDDRFRDNAGGRHRYGFPFE